MTTPKKSVKKQTVTKKQVNKEAAKPNNIKQTKTKKQILPIKSVGVVAEKIDADTIFAQALLRHKKELMSDKKEQFKEMSHLALIAQEYLSSFALIGYSLQDERVVMFNMPTPKDEAALVDLLRATFVDIVSNRP